MKAWDVFYANSSGLICAGDKILLAVSGGQDSMSMLHMFYRLSKKINISFAVLNFDHGLRKESASESRLVKSYCKKISVECFIKKLDVKRRCAEKGVSVETAARDLRYANLEQIAKTQKCNKIATAHNANDNAETVLMMLMRGSGALCGIPQIRKTAGNIKIIRPLLEIGRKQIEEYVKKQKLPYCTDKSNFSTEYTRNKIRLSLMPVIKEINPKAVEHIFSLSRIQSREDAYLEEISAKFLKKCARFSKNRILLDLPMFLRYNETIRYRILKNVLPDKKYASRINFIMDKILSSASGQYALSMQWVFRLKKTAAEFVRVKR
ncbi:MAG: tRNA lysidine(34) synthetase TilS [Endomicrobium sp.]|jgi:tRNA(Ile)-lysidine synthase|nr:tRNA lysidine(34) synthetase TilS [Endomicrobium sp.]